MSSMQTKESYHAETKPIIGDNWEKLIDAGVKPFKYQIELAIADIKAKNSNWATQWQYRIVKITTIKIVEVV